ncbi:MAG: hypothetical protein WA194_04305 [Patescibacteria group bacterium]
MRKKNASLILVGTLAASAIAAGVSANEMESSTSGMTSTSTSASTGSQDSSYWQARKLEMQKKSTEMRVKKVAEMAAAGIDVSAITGDLLDGTKTEESAFWTAAKIAMNAHEIASRKAYLEKLKAQGVDVSSITDDVIADGEKFWEAVRKLTANQKAPSTQNGNASSSGELKEFLRTDLTADETKALSALMAEVGKAIGAVLNDKTLSVDDKVAKILEIQKANAEVLATKYVDPAKVDAFRTKSEKKLAEMAEYVRKSLNSGTTPPPPATSNGEQGKNRGDQKANPLSPKFRKSLETKLRAIPDEKKDEFYQRAKTVIGAQIEKAKAANKPKLVAKLEAVMAIVEDILGPTDGEDSAIIDSIFSSGSITQ